MCRPLGRQEPPLPLMPSVPQCVSSPCKGEEIWLPTENPQGCVPRKLPSPITPLARNKVPTPPLWESHPE